MKTINLILKRIFDIVTSLIILILLFPFLVVVSLAVLLFMGGPVLFTQQRAGLHGTPFYIFKFSSMSDKRNEKHILLDDEERLTKLGRFIRRLSIDELPQLINILKGDMSVVGPRPLLMEYVKRYSNEHKRRLNMKPGVTGLAQIKGRNALLFSQRLQYDVEYVNSFNILLDLKIFFLTIYKVIFIKLQDRAGQDVTVVDDLGLHDRTLATKHMAIVEKKNA